MLILVNIQLDRLLLKSLLCEGELESPSIELFDIIPGYKDLDFLSPFGYDLDVEGL
jgi:hypothetical protein